MQSDKIMETGWSRCGRRFEGLRPTRGTYAHAMRTLPQTTDEVNLFLMKFFFENLKHSITKLFLIIKWNSFQQY